MSDTIDNLIRQHHGTTLVKIKDAKRTNKQLSHKILQLLKSVQILKNKGYALHPNEEQLVHTFETMNRDLEKPSVFRGR
jgi:nuclear pore complex protein Nup54